MKYLLSTVSAGALLCVAAAPAYSNTYAIDPTHTKVHFEAKHFGTSTNRGRFDKKEGTIVFDPAAKTGSAEITIDTASISTGVAPFDSHLKSKDFFNAAEHPTARFVGEKFSFGADNKVTAVSGNLTLVGKTQPVTLVANNFNCYDHPRLKREVCGGDFETVIERSQFGINYGLPGIPDKVRLLIQVEAIKQ